MHCKFKELYKTIKNCIIYCLNSIKIEIASKKLFIYSLVVYVT